MMHLKPLKTRLLFLGGIVLWAVYFSTGCTTGPQPLSSPAPATSSISVTLSTPASSAAAATLANVTPAQAASATPVGPQPETAMAPTQATQPPQATLPARPTLRPGEWESLPAIPAISNHILEIYRRGLELGNNPQAFSKIGDCGSTPAWFLGDFDRGPAFYDLGNYQGLQNVIAYYQGSYDRTSLAARSGFNASSLFVSLWSDRNFCKANEGPLECEYRVHRPILAFIMLGTNDIYHPQDFEPQMRRIIEFSLNSGVIPVLSTKADNTEGDGSINATIARLANEYDIPLWNYWAAVQMLPDQGLQEDQAHLTWGRNFFNDPEALSKAWPIRNLTALQMLNAIWQKLNSASNQ